MLAQSRRSCGKTLFDGIVNYVVMDAGDEDDDLDFADLFDDFNNADFDVAQQISDNLRAQAGIAGETVLHQGEADEGRITWTAPTFSGLTNSTLVSEKALGSYNRDMAEDELWDDLAPDEAGSAEEVAVSNVSQNLSDNWEAKTSEAEQAIKMMEEDEVKDAAECFDRLAAHGKGHVVLDVQEFQELLMKLSMDDKGRRLLELLLVRPKAKRRQRSREL